MANVKIGKLSEIKPTSRNSNKHTARGMKSLDNSMAQDGYVAPMTATADGEIIDGDARLHTAFERFGDEAIVIHHDGTKPIVMVRDDIPNAEHPMARRIHYRANLTAWQNLDLDPAVVMADIEAGFDFEAIDVSLPDLGELLGKSTAALLAGETAGKDTEPQIDKAEELRVKWGVEPGQMWQLGDHRIICGDCTDEAIVARVMGGERFNLMVTDPPYGVNYEGGRNPVSNVPREKLKGDLSPALYDAFLSVWKNHREEKGVLYIWFASSVGKPVYTAIEANGFEIRALIVWNKIDAHYGNFMAQYMQKHEPCLYCVNGGTNWYGPTNEVTVWDIKQPNVNEFHPTQKPIECMERPIKNSSKVGDLVADPFSGSGTTIIACENLGRHCRAIEIDAGYVAVAIERWQQHTGKEPVLIG